MVIAAEGARTDTGLTAGFRVSSGGLGVSVKSPRGCAGTVVNSSAITAHSTLHVRCYAPLASPSVVIVAVVKRVAPGVVPVVVIHPISSIPVVSPVVPAPAKAAKVANSEAKPE